MYNPTDLSDINYQLALAADEARSIRVNQYLDALEDEAFTLHLIESFNRLQNDPGGDDRNGYFYWD